MSELEIVVQNFPNYKVSGIKAIQVKVRDKLVTRFAAAEDYHFQILESILREEKVHYNIIIIAGIEPVAEPEGLEYTLIGAGRAAIDPQARTMEFEGHSTAYSIGWNSNILRVKEVYPEWTVTAKNFLQKPISF